MKKNLPLVAIIGILFATGVVFSRAFIGQMKLGIPVVLGDEGESSDAEKASDESSQEASKKQAEIQQEASKKQAEDQQEASKKQTENQREFSKKQWENQREASKKQAEIQQEGDKQEGDNLDEQDGDSNDVQGEIADINKEVAKIESKIAPLATSDLKAFEAFNTSLGEIKTLVAQLDATKDPIQLKTLVETIDHKMESLDKMMEVAFENDNEQANETDHNDNEDVAKQYGSSVAQFVHTLKTVEEADNDENKGIGEQVKVVAQAQNDSQVKVENSINNIKERSGFVKFLIGPKYDSIAEVQKAVTENQTRIDVLTGLLGQITDPTVKLVLQDQITSLQQQNTKLQAFAADSEKSVSLFGWLAKLFS